jgi:hypothetical protein
MIFDAQNALGKHLRSQVVSFGEKDLAQNVERLGQGLVMVAKPLFTMVDGGADFAFGFGEAGEREEVFAKGAVTITPKNRFALRVNESRALLKGFDGIVGAMEEFGGFEAKQVGV